MWEYNQTENMHCSELYHNPDELYHYGVLGMRWRFKKGPQIKSVSSNKKSQGNQTSSGKKKWSTKKKIAVGAAAIAAIGAGVYFGKKYINKQNSKIATNEYNRIMSIGDRQFAKGQMYGGKFSVEKARSNPIKVDKLMKKQLASYQNNAFARHDKIKNAKFRDQIKNVYRYKKYGHI